MKIPWEQVRKDLGIEEEYLNENEFRESIAKQIENNCKGIVPQYAPCSHCQDAADIVRNSI